jgi:hypothetical protein
MGLKVACMALLGFSMREALMQTGGLSERDFSDSVLPLPSGVTSSPALRIAAHCALVLQVAAP